MGCWALSLWHPEKQCSYELSRKTTILLSTRPGMPYSHSISAGLQFGRILLWLVNISSVFRVQGITWGEKCLVRSPCLGLSCRYTLACGDTRRLDSRALVAGVFSLLKGLRMFPSPEQSHCYDREAERTNYPPRDFVCRAIRTDSVIKTKKLLLLVLEWEEWLFADEHAPDLQWE